VGRNNFKKIAVISGIYFLHTNTTAELNFLKRPRREVDHVHLASRSRKRGAIPSLLQNAFMAWCSVKAQGQLYLYLKGIRN
jgi:hypothetical protein